MKFAKQLKELRTEKGLSYKQLEGAVGIDDSTLCRWENGQLDATCENLVKIAKFFGVSVDFLLGIEN